jgi:hypothetical protein
VQYLRALTSSSAPPAWDKGSSDEIAQIERLKRACRSIDYHWDVECSCSDEGDPWCAVYDWRRDRPVVHVARIDGTYVTEFPSRLRSSSSTTLHAAIDAALAEIAPSPTRIEWEGRQLLQTSCATLDHASIVPLPIKSERA